MWRVLGRSIPIHGAQSSPRASVPPHRVWRVLGPSIPPHGVWRVLGLSIPPHGAWSGLGVSLPNQVVLSISGASPATRHGASRERAPQAGRCQTSPALWQWHPRPGHPPSLSLALGLGVAGGTEVSRDTKHPQRDFTLLGKRKACPRPRRPAALPEPVPPGPSASTAHPRPHLPILCRLRSEPGSERFQASTHSFLLFHLIPISSTQPPSYRWGHWGVLLGIPFPSKPGAGVPCPSGTHTPPAPLPKPGPPTPRGCPRALAPGEESSFQALVGELLNAAVEILAPARALVSTAVFGRETRTINRQFYLFQRGGNGAGKTHRRRQPAPPLRGRLTLLTPSKPRGGGTGSRAASVEAATR